ncbi:MAG: hemolysin III family protein [Chloroflexota bacterium]
MVTTNNNSQSLPAQTKPLLRGWFHAAGALASIIFTLVLVWVSADDLPRMLSMLVFGVSMIELYTVSAIYHIGRWQPGTHRVLRSFDHSNIFILIAGTYTPICFNVLDGWVRVTSLIAIWALALVGVFVVVFARNLPRWVGSIIYIAMGWVSIVVLPAFVEALGWGPVLVLIMGGVLYTIGGIIYAMKRPNPFPRVLGFHEVFHLFVIAGSIVFAVVVSVWVLPFPRV